MKSVENQLNDWTEIKKLCKVIPIRKGTYKQESIKELHGRIKSYYFMYKQKFDFTNPPKLL